MQIDEAVRVVAEFDGWEFLDVEADGTMHWRHGRNPPDYAHDRDALIEVAKKLDKEAQYEFLAHLDLLVHPIGQTRSRSIAEWCDSDVLRILTAPANLLLLAIAKTIKEGKSL